ncbi:hypothetical protein DFH28DRAFT_407252 [Melampsora americana]|nr:hypothetical protein DFH28DRAFT_407252 [Melampsora americana]
MFFSNDSDFLKLKFPAIFILSVILCETIWIMAAPIPSQLIGMGEDIGRLSGNAAKNSPLELKDAGKGLNNLESTDDLMKTTKAIDPAQDSISMSKVKNTGSDTVHSAGFSKLGDDGTNGKFSNKAVKFFSNIKQAFGRALEAISKSSRGFSQRIARLFPKKSFDLWMTRFENLGKGFMKRMKKFRHNKKVQPEKTLVQETQSGQAAQLAMGMKSTPATERLMTSSPSVHEQSSFFSKSGQALRHIPSRIRQASRQVTFKRIVEHIPHSKAWKAKQQDRMAKANY